jgi:hypothetical protein
MKLRGYPGTSGRVPTAVGAVLVDANCDPDDPLVEILLSNLSHKRVLNLFLPLVEKKWLSVRLKSSLHI